MQPQQLRKIARPCSSSSFNRYTSGLPISYLKTRIRGSRLLNAVRILVLLELTQRLHQAYRQAYDKQASDWLLPQNPPGDVSLSSEQRKIVEDINGSAKYFMNKSDDCKKYIQGTSTEDPSKVLDKLEWYNGITYFNGRNLQMMKEMLPLQTAALGQEGVVVLSE